MDVTADVMTIHETAARLGGVPDRTVYRWVRTGALPAFRLGNRWFILRQRFDEMLRGEWKPTTSRKHRNE